MESMFIIRDGTLVAYNGSEKILIIPTVIQGKRISKIGKSVFECCDELEEVYLSPTIHVLDDYAFASCPSLRSVYVPEHLESVGSFCFCDCASLEVLMFLNGISKVGEDAFSGCKRLVKSKFSNLC